MGYCDVVEESISGDTSELSDHPPKVYDLLRSAIADELAKIDAILKGELEADESYFGGKRKGSVNGGVKVYRFGRNKSVHLGA